MNGKNKERDIFKELLAFNAKITPSGLSASNKTSNPLDALIGQYYKGTAASNRAAYISNVLTSFGKPEEQNLVSDKFMGLPETAKDVIRTIANRYLNFRGDKMSVSTVNSILKMQLIDSMLSNAGVQVAGFIDVNDPKLNDMNSSQIVSALHAMSSWSYIENIKADMVDSTIPDVLFMLNHFKTSNNKKAFETIMSLFEMACGYLEIADTLKMLTDHISSECMINVGASVNYGYENPFEGEEYEEDLTMSDMESMKMRIYEHVSKLGNANLINPKAINAILANSTSGELRDMYSIINKFDRVLVPIHFKSSAPIIANMDVDTAIDKNPNEQLLMVYISSVGCRIKKIDNSPANILAMYKSVVNKPLKVSEFEVSRAGLLSLDLDIFKNKRFTYAYGLANKDLLLVNFAKKFLTHIRGVAPLNRTELLSRSGQKPVSMSVVRQFMKDGGYIESENDSVNSMLYQSIANWANKKK